jgi:hypothetical protein
MRGIIKARESTFGHSSCSCFTSLHRSHHKMSSLQYFDYEGFGERSKRDLNYSQAVRIENRIEISGQGQLAL